MARNTFPERYERFETLMLNFVNLGVLVGDTPVLHKAIECVRANPSTRNRFNLVYVMFGCMAEQDMKALTQLVEYMAEHEASLAPGTRSLNLLALLLWLKSSPNAEAPALVVRILDMLWKPPTKGTGTWRTSFTRWPPLLQAPYVCNSATRKTHWRAYVATASRFCCRL
jgi:hypothetical protein